MLAVIIDWIDPGYNPSSYLSVCGKAKGLIGRRISSARSPVLTYPLRDLLHGPAVIDERYVTPRRTNLFPWQNHMNNYQRKRESNPTRGKEVTVVITTVVMYVCMYGRWAVGPPRESPIPRDLAVDGQVRSKWKRICRMWDALLIDWVIGWLIDWLLLPRFPAPGSVTPSETWRQLRSWTSSVIYIAHLKQRNCAMYGYDISEDLRSTIPQFRSTIPIIKLSKSAPS